MREYFEDFGKPFPASDVSWRLQYVNKEKMQGIAVPYLDARAIADRLDEVVGQMNWKDSYTPWHDCTGGKKTKQSQLCTISIFDAENNQWIDKTDGAEDSDIEPIKGGLSDAFKRAAVKWNIGRYLYSFSTVWVTAVERGDSYVIADSEKSKLEDAYNKQVAKIFGGSAPTTTTKAPSQKPDVTPGNSGQPGAEKPTQNDDIYEVRKIQVQDNRSSILLFGNGKQFQAFMNGTDARLQPGTRIKNINAQKGKNAYGSYAILGSYDIAA